MLQLPLIYFPLLKYLAIPKIFYVVFSTFKCANHFLSYVYFDLLFLPGEGKAWKLTKPRLHA